MKIRTLALSALCMLLASPSYAAKVKEKEYTLDSKKSAKEKKQQRKEVFKPKSEDEAAAIRQADFAKEKQ